MFFVWEQSNAYVVPMANTEPVVPLFAVHHNGHRYLLSASREQLIGINDALNEVCNGGQIEDPEFQTRLGIDRSKAQAILDSVSQVLSSDPKGPFEIATAWTDGGSVQIRCYSAYGDPVDMSSTEARQLAQLLVTCADKADAIFQS